MGLGSFLQLETVVERWATLAFAELFTSFVANAFAERAVGIKNAKTCNRRNILSLSESVYIVQFGVFENQRMCNQVSLNQGFSIRDSACTESSYLGGTYDAPNSYPLIYNRKPHSRRAALTCYRIRMFEL